MLISPRARRFQHLVIWKGKSVELGEFRSIFINGTSASSHFVFKIYACFLSLYLGTLIKTTDQIFVAVIGVDSTYPQSFRIPQD